MKNTIPIKIPLLFSRPKKIRASFIDPQKSLLAKMSETNSEVGIFLGIKYEPLSDPPPSLKYVSGAPGCTALQVSYEPEPNELPKERLRGRQEFGGLIFGGAYFWNFTVCLCLIRPWFLSMIFLIAGDFFSNSTDWRSCRISSQPFYPLCIQLNHH